MSRFIESGKRYGLEPWQLGVEYDRSTGETYITGTPAGQVANERFATMLDALGMSRHGPRIIPHEEGVDMLEAIDKAIESSLPKVGPLNALSSLLRTLSRDEPILSTTQITKLIGQIDGLEAYVHDYRNLPHREAAMGPKTG